MQKETDKINVLIYTAGSSIFFLASSVISNGLLVVKDKKGKTLKQNVISNSNYGILEIENDISDNNKTITACIISKEITYEKNLIL